MDVLALYDIHGNVDALDAVLADPRAADPDVVERTLGDRVDFLLDTGPTRGGLPSTMVDVSGAEPRLVRDGAISWREIQAWLDTPAIDRRA